MILFLPSSPPHVDTSNSSPSHFKVILYFPPFLICGGFPDGSVGKESTCQCRRRRRRGFDSWVRKIPWWRKWGPTPVFFLGKSSGPRSLTGYKYMESQRVGHSWATEHAHTHARFRSRGRPSETHKPPLLPALTQPSFRIPQIVMGPALNQWPEGFFCDQAHL